MRATSFFFTVAVTVSTLAFAAKTPKPAPPPPPVVSTNPPSVSLAITAAQPARGWTMRVTNNGLEPLRIVADARLLTLEVTPSGGGAVVRCALPAEMRPLTDVRRSILLVAGRSYTETFDPRLYCFAEHDSDALAAGATVVARLGFSPTALAAPFEVMAGAEPIDGGVAPSPAKEIVSAPLTLPASAEQPAPDAVGPVSDVFPVRLTATMPARLDWSDAFEREVTIGLKNEGLRAVTLMLRTGTAGFFVETPKGNVVRCGASAMLPSIGELLTTVTPGGHSSVSVDVTSVCPDVFDRPGVYVVRPRIDTRRVSGGAPSYQGEAVGRPSLVRVRVGRGDDRPAPVVDPPK